jgi:hypothetical protein
VRRQAIGAGPAVAPPAVNDVLRSPGQPLDPAAQVSMGRAFAHDFSQVRVHTDARAAVSAQAVQARAYTVGRHVVFGAGQYAPDAGAGRRLLAHELTHVVQQRGGAQVAPTFPLRVGESTSQAEREADAHSALSGPAERRFSQTPLGVVHRQPADTESKDEPKPVVGQAVLDDLAFQIHDAIDRLGTDEEAVYAALQRLDRDPDAVLKLENTYQRKYGSSLLRDIEDDFSGEELEYALQLMGRGDTRSAQAIQAAPTSGAEFSRAADRLHTAMDRPGTDEEAVYAVLRPFDRRLDLLGQLSGVYAQKFKHELRADIDDEMSGSELEYALWLLGEQKLEPEQDRLLRLQSQFMETKRKEAEAEARKKAEAEAEAKGKPPPKPEELPKSSMSDVVTSDAAKHALKPASTDAWTKLPKAARDHWKDERAPAAFAKVLDSIKGTELEKVMAGHQLKFEPVKVLELGAYAYESEGTMVVGMTFVQDVEKDSKNAWALLAHEIGGHFEYGTTYSSRFMDRLRDLLPEAERKRWTDTKDGRNTFFQSYLYAETEIFSALRQRRYDVPVSGPKPVHGAMKADRMIEVRLDQIESVFHREVGRAILVGLNRKVQASSDILDRDKQFFLEEVKKRGYSL